MNESIVKARKIHVCDICNGLIQKGQKHIHGTGREPKYDHDYNQVGIEYINYRRHLDDCYPYLLQFDINTVRDIFNKCRKKQHDWVEEFIPSLWYNEDGSGDYTGEYFCSRCGIYKDNKNNK